MKVELPATPVVSRPSLCSEPWFALEGDVARGRPRLNVVVELGPNQMSKGGTRGALLLAHDVVPGSPVASE